MVRIGGGTGDLTGLIASKRKFWRDEKLGGARMGQAMGHRPNIIRYSSRAMFGLDWSSIF